jgi:SAM-dependent methyltransferase
MSQGWDESAQAWINVMGEEGDWGRRYVLDTPMLTRVRNGQYRNAVDIGCGEGRFCRMLHKLGIRSVGIDPTNSFIERARQQHAEGDYRVGRAEHLPLDANSMDLAVAYLSLIDIDDMPQAVCEAHRVLRRGGRFLIANLQSFNTACTTDGWKRSLFGMSFSIDHYLQERPIWSEWRGIRIQNWHRPMQSYMKALLDCGFVLRHFDEPAPQGVDDAKADRYRRVPNFFIMEWEKV